MDTEEQLKLIEEISAETLNTLAIAAEAARASGMSQGIVKTKDWSAEWTVIDGEAQIINLIKLP